MAHRITQSTRTLAPLALLLAGSLAFSSGCRIDPKGAQAERDRVAAAGKPYEKPFEKRALPELPDRPDWRDLLQRAFLANGEIEAAYFEWRAAVARMDAAAAYPNTRLNLGVDYMFSRERLSAWDRTTLSAGFDPQMMLQWPGKVRQAAQVALDASRARADRLAAAKFALQQRVLTTWLDYALDHQRLAIERENLELLRMIASIAAQRV
ncbi:MAG: TolC family protein, partial [Planctomycetota bacterium]|nr:TolC family protein [Planctomycetota bacterium]